MANLLELAMADGAGQFCLYRRRPACQPPRVAWSDASGLLAGLSLALLLWQWLAARRFPLHTRRSGHASGVPAAPFAPGVTLLKPLKGCDPATRECLRSWLAQEYAGPVQALFCVGDAADPAASLVRELAAEFPAADVRLLVNDTWPGPNAKVCKLIRLQAEARHDVLVISDADTRVPPDFLAHLIAPLREDAIGLVNCFYTMANPTTAAMRWEATGIAADFWSQVLQSNTLKPMDFALGAVMATRRGALEGIGGFAALVDFLADDYQLGHQIARAGGRLELSPLVVECHEREAGWRAIWTHQLRWARTIRACQPAPYFFSLLNNVTLWLGLWLITGGVAVAGHVATGLLARALVASDLQRRLNRSCDHVPWLWMIWVKDLLGALIWAGAFLGNTVTWRGERYRIVNGGRLRKLAAG